MQIYKKKNRNQDQRGTQSEGENMEQGKARTDSNGVTNMGQQPNGLGLNLDSILDFWVTWQVT